MLLGHLALAPNTARAIHIERTRPMGLPPTPPSLAPLAPYFDRAAELQTSQPMAAHYVRVFAMQLALKLKQKDANASGFLMALMELLEKEKAAGLPLPPPKVVTRPAPAPAPAPTPAPTPAPAPESVPAAAEEGAGAGAGSGAGSGVAEELRLKEEGKLVLTLGKATGLKKLSSACVAACVNGVERRSKPVKGEGALHFDESFEFTGVLSTLLAQGLRLQLTERNTFSKDEELGAMLVALDDLYKQNTLELTKPFPTQA